MITKKHYKVIAEIIDSTKLTQNDFVNPYDEKCIGTADGINVTRKEIAEKLADYFAKDNSHFDRQRFLTTCSVL